MSTVINPVTEKLPSIPLTHEKPAGKLMDIPLHKIRENSEALRNKVNKKTPEWAEFVSSIRRLGIINPISVREVPLDPNNPDAGVVYGLVDGLHRYTGAQDANLETIPARVLSIKEADLLEAQIVANVQKIQTTNKQYRAALLGMLRSNPLLTKRELAERVSKSSKWLDDQLSLLDLNEDIQKMVDEGSIGLTNAYQLAKLPKEQQKDLLQQALSMSPAEFIPLSQGRIKELEKARKEGRAPKTDEFVPIPRLQKIPAINNEIQSFASGQFGDSIVARLLEGVTDPKQAAAITLKWVMHLDTKSIEADKEAHAARLKQREEDKKTREIERQKKKDEEAAEKMKQLQP